MGQLSTRSNDCALRGLRRCVCGAFAHRPPRGCTALPSKPSWAFIYAARCCDLNPCIPRAWRGFERLYRYRSASDRLRFDNPQEISSGIVEATLDGVPLSPSPCQISLRDDGREHVGVIRLDAGSNAATPRTPRPPSE
jgi:hypothetical protein